MNNIFKRIITSIFLIVLLIFALYYNDFTWNSLIIFFILLCLHEFYNLIDKIFKGKFFFQSY